MENLRAVLRKLNYTLCDVCIERLKKGTDCYYRVAEGRGEMYCSYFEFDFQFVGIVCEHCIHRDSCDMITYDGSENCYKFVLRR